MPVSRNGGRRRHWWRPLIPGLSPVAVAVLCGATNFLTSLPSHKWISTHHAVIIWSFAGGLVLAIVLEVIDTLHSPQADRDQVFVTDSASPLVPGQSPDMTRRILGERIPAEPAAFVERPAVADLARAWALNKPARTAQAVIGGPGVGKTEAAAAYARNRVAEGCPLVAWVKAETQDQLLTGLADVATAVGVADPSGDSAVSAEYLRVYLENGSDPALLVFDDATDIEALSAFLPSVGPVQIVITSRDRDFRLIAKMVDIGSFTPEQSVAYLNERTRLTDPGGAAAVAAELGHLPLALAQASTAISKHELNYAVFQQRIRDGQAAKYLIHHSGEPYRRGAIEAIALAIASAEEQDESGLTSMVIALLGVLSAEGVCRPDIAGLADLATTASSYSSVRAGSEALDEALGRLVDRSIIIRSQNGMTFSMHSMVRRVVQEREKADGRLPKILSFAADLLHGLRIPAGEERRCREAGNWLIGQINALWAIFSELNRADVPQQAELAKRLISLRNWSVHQLVAAADLSRAISLGVTVLADCERVLGLDHPDTLTSRDRLANAYESAGKIYQASKLRWQNATTAKRIFVAGCPDRRFYRLRTWTRLFPWALLTLFILWNAYLTIAGDYYPLVLFSLWLVFCLLIIPATGITRRLLAVRA